MDYTKRTALEQIIEQAKMALIGDDKSHDLALIEIERIARFARTEVKK